MAATDDEVGDHWPSLPPIRTSTPAAAHLPACDIACQSLCYSVDDGAGHLQEGGHGGSEAGLASNSSAVSCMLDANSRISCLPPSRSERATDTDSDDAATQGSCGYGSCRKSYARFFSCFSCTRTRLSSSPRPRRCMQRRGPLLRSMALFFGAGGLQSFYSSPTGQAAQLSGAFPRTLSAGARNLHCYSSPRTPGCQQAAGKLRSFSSPRTPGLGPNVECMSAAARTPASGKVRHFSGSIPSPRTPFGIGAASPASSARQRTTKFTLFMPPTSPVGAAGYRKNADEDQQDEPTSPHVTCIGKVGRQTHCKTLRPKDVINSHAHCRAMKARKKNSNASTSHKKPPDEGPASAKRCHNTASSSDKESTKAGSAMELLRMPQSDEVCRQNFGRSRLHNLYKIRSISDESIDADPPDHQVSVEYDCEQEHDPSPASSLHPVHSGTHVVS